MVRDFAILATGPSMSAALAERVRERGFRAVAVSNAWQLAPWAEAMASGDAKWWQKNPAAHAFGGRKFSLVDVPGCETLPIASGSNSSLLAMYAAKFLGAQRIFLFGVDMHSRDGAHYFGDHPTPLTNTSDVRFSIMKRQFERFSGCDVYNCTVGSDLQCFPHLDPRTVLC